MSEETTLDEFAKTEHSEERKETPIGKIPSDWDVEWLNDVVSINSDGFSEGDWPSETFEYISLSEASNGEIERSKTTPLEEAPSRAQRTVQQGDVLVGTVRPKQKSHGFVNAEHDGKICSSGFGVLRTGANLNSRYLIQEILSNRFFSQMEAYVAGSGYPAVKLSDLKKHRVSVPPLSEQRKIATVLYTIDQAIEKTEEIIQQVKRTKKGLVNEIVTGGVNADNYQPMRVGPHEFNIPNHWNIVSIQEACENLDSERIPVSKSNRENMQGEIPYYGASGCVDFVDDYLFDEPLILLAEDGENLRSRTQRVAFKITGKSWVNNHAHVLRPKDGFELDYLVEYLERLDYRPYVSGSAQPKLNQTMLNKITVPKPPLEEQKKIASMLNGFKNRLSHETDYRDRLLGLKRGLMQDLLLGTVRTTDTNIQVPEEIAQYG